MVEFGPAMHASPRNVTPSMPVNARRRAARNEATLSACAISGAKSPTMQTTAVNWSNEGSTWGPGLEEYPRLLPGLAAAR